MDLSAGIVVPISLAAGGAASWALNAWYYRKQTEAFKKYKEEQEDSVENIFELKIAKQQNALRTECEAAFNRSMEELATSVAQAQLDAERRYQEWRVDSTKDRSEIRQRASEERERLSLVVQKVDHLQHDFERFRAVVETSLGIGGPIDVWPERQKRSDRGPR